MILKSVFYRSFQVDSSYSENFFSRGQNENSVLSKHEENFLTRWIFYLHRQKERGRKKGMSSKKEIEDALNLVKLKFDDPNLKPRFASFSKNMQFTFPDLKATYLIRVNNGVVQSLSEESIPTPDINVTIDSDVLIGIMNKTINPMTAYQTGKLKAKGNLTDLLKLQKLL